ncbi:MAG: hypothetical protein KME29_04960 [Calothrix sp. FI2-JRJ7]|jgi:DNA polymerase III delta prime subunit|nr:hypothetical protein [Calothrix sp. FI2-JRJ7]
MQNKYAESDYMGVFEKEWKRLVCDEGGNLILDKVARELHDYSLLMENCTNVLQEYTFLSKPFTRADYVVEKIDEIIERRVQERLEEEIRRLREEAA